MVVALESNGICKSESHLFSEDRSEKIIWHIYAREAGRLSVADVADFVDKPCHRVSVSLFFQRLANDPTYGLPEAGGAHASRPTM